MGKEIIILLDGTSNSPENQEPPTNIDILKQMLSNGERPLSFQTIGTGWDLYRYELDKPRIVLYDRGLGSPTLNEQGQVQGWSWNVLTNMRVVYNKFFKEISEATIASGIVDNVAEAYSLLALHYKKNDNDQVFMFGFSRGAYTLRLLITLIRHIGLIQIDKLDEPALYNNSNVAANQAKLMELIKQGFSTFDRHQHPDTNHAAQTFRDRYCYSKEECQGLIHFIGLFDTVRGCVMETVHEDSKLTSVVKTARHALAIDERRPAFKPELWVPSIETDSQQVWFAGVHADVGGGYHDRGLSNIALRWILKEAFKTGLFIDQATLAKYGVALTVSSTADQSTDSIGCLGVQHDSFHASVAKGSSLTWRDVSLGNQYRRPMLQTVKGEAVHKSVARRYGKNVPVASMDNKIPYQPSNLSHALVAAHNAKQVTGSFFTLKAPDADDLSDAGEEDSLVRAKTVKSV